MQLSKKAYIRKKASKKEASHYEGKYFCNCRTGNIRKWLAIKKFGKPEQILTKMIVGTG